MSIPVGHILSPVLRGGDVLEGQVKLPLPCLLNPLDYLFGLLEKLLTNPYIYGFLRLWDLYLGGVPYHDAILVALLLLVPALIVFLIWFLRRPRLKAPSRRQTGADLRRTAKKAAKQGDFVRAGELYEMAEWFDDAIKMYLEGKSPLRASQVYLNKLQDPEKAIALCLKSNLYEGAAKAYAQTGRYIEAGQHFKKANKEQAAAEAFEKGGELLEAGELYLKNHMLREAARCFGKTPDHLRAGESYEAYYREISGSFAADNIPADKAKALGDLAKKAGYFFKSAGEMDRAVSILLDAGLKPYAAELLVERGEIERAVELYLEVGQNLRAADICTAHGRHKPAAEIRAQYHLKLGQNREAVRYFEEAGDYLSAADLYAGMGELLKAAELFMKGGDSKTAAETFFAAGQPERAAETYEAVGDLTRAIQAYEQSGNEGKLSELYERARNFYEAGNLYQKRGLLDKAIACYLKVGKEDPHWSEVTHRLGDSYLEIGKYPQALEKYQQLVSQKPLNPDNLDLYYNLAILYERTNQFGYAHTIYSRILAIHPHFKDVPMRENALRQRMSGPSMPGTASAPAMTPHDYTMVGGAPPGQVRGPSASRYQILREIGRGGMGVVYLAKDMNLGRQVAYKVLPPELKHNPQFVATFIREAKSLAQLGHPYIVSIFDAGEEGGNYFIIMEYVEGQNLKDLLARSRKIPISSGIQIFSQLCQALDYAHGKKVVHRDIKTGNLMWTQSQIIKVMDFGLAKVIEEAQAGRTAVSGTPYYMSPEQTLGKALDHRTDIYSLGATMYEILTGQVPFKDGDIGYQQVHTPPRPPRELNPEIPETLQRIILKCLAKDPAQRYQSAREIYLELKALER